MPDISVIIPTRNRAALLGRCLAALCAQTLDPVQFEICVVSNGSTDKTPQAVDLVKSHFPAHTISLIDESKLGVANARNTGIANTTTPLIAFIDDDASAPPQWLEHFIKSFATQDAHTAKIAGDIVSQWGAACPEWITEGMLPLLAAMGCGATPRFITDASPETQSCYRRAALQEAGNFPVTLGRKGNNLLSGEGAVDLVLLSQGHKIFYDPSITVTHAISPDRLSPAWWRRRFFWQGVTDHAIMLYLQSKNIIVPAAPEMPLPLDRDNWAFINDATEIPTMENLEGLRSLGCVLAKSKFITI